MTDAINPWLDSAIDAVKEVTQMLGIMEHEVVRQADAISDWEPGIEISLGNEQTQALLRLYADPTDLATVAYTMLGCTPDECELADTEVNDAVGEIANMLAGCMKTQLLDDYPDLQLGLPSFNTEQPAANELQIRRNVALTLGDAQLTMELLLTSSEQS